MLHFQHGRDECIPDFSLPKNNTKVEVAHTPPVAIDLSQLGQTFDRAIEDAQKTRQKKNPTPNVGQIQIFCQTDQECDKLRKLRSHLRSYGFDFIEVRNATMPAGHENLPLLYVNGVFKADASYVLQLDFSDLKKLVSN